MRRIPWQVLAGLSLPVLAACPGRADAGWLVEQTVGYGGGAQSSEATFIWRIGDNGEFRADVVRPGQTKIFLFNGRVFFGCGKLDKAQLDFVRKLDLKDKAVLASLEKGVCQELATDFGIRFFMAPHDAAAQIEVAEGFGAKAALADSEVELTGTVDTVAGTKCVNFTRSFTIGDRADEDVEHEVKEKACNASVVKWRTAMVKELGKTMIRQAGGAPNYKAMNADLKRMGGLSLTSVSQVSGKDAAGKKFARSVTVSTSSLKEQAFGGNEFQTPQGYTMLDAQSLALSGKGKKEPAAAKLEQSGGSVSDVVSFFLRGGNPAGMLLGAPEK